VTGLVSIAQALSNRTLLIVAAHPDDETVGAGGFLPRMRRATIVTVTDGAPRNPMDAKRAGCSSREDYARLRRQELLSALAVAGIPPTRARALNLVDQEASLEMAYLTMHIVDLLKEVRPTAILTHAYEGGHPDHDATAFAVHAACARVHNPPTVFEFASYHAADHHEPVLKVGDFLPDGEEVDTIPLSADARDRKRRMVECFASQIHMLQHWPLDVERYREAPTYDFTRPPHEGALYYEHFDWGVTGERWRLLAEEALRTLGAATAAP
jgi:LmbE family N-acetylglucosaminyl deacetylase